MGGATIWPVPRAMDAEAHYYPRRWKRNWIFLYGGLFLTGIQINRYAALHRVSYALLLQNHHRKLTCIFFLLAIDYAHGRIHGLGKQGCSKARQVRLNGLTSRPSTIAYGKRKETCVTHYWSSYLTHKKHHEQMKQYFNIRLKDSYIYSLVKALQVK